jgi:D-aminopeptidase
MGLARGGSYASNGSGEQFLAFSTANRLPRDRDVYEASAIVDGRRGITPLLREAVEATEEAVVNALVAADTVVGRDGNTLFAIPTDELCDVLAAAGRLAR